MEENDDQTKLVGNEGRGCCQAGCESSFNGWCTYCFWKLIRSKGDITFEGWWLLAYDLNMMRKQKCNYIKRYCVLLTSVRRTFNQCREQYIIWKLDEHIELPPNNRYPIERMKFIIIKMCAW